MANASAVLKQADLTRYAKAMRAAGITEWRLRTKPDGTTELIVGQAAIAADNNDWDSL